MTPNKSLKPTPPVLMSTVSLSSFIFSPFHACSRRRGLALVSLDVMRSREAAGCDWASQPHLLDTAFVAGTIGKKAAWQQANPFHNISNDRGGACG
jgi:hypothetical protein